MPYFDLSNPGWMLTLSFFTFLKKVLDVHFFVCFFYAIMFGSAFYACSEAISKSTYKVCPRCWPWTEGVCGESSLSAESIYGPTGGSGSWKIPSGSWVGFLMVFMIWLVEYTSFWYILRTLSSTLTAPSHPSVVQHTWVFWMWLEEVGLFAKILNTWR